MCWQRQWQPTATLFCEGWGRGPQERAGCLSFSATLEARKRAQYFTLAGCLLACMQLEHERGELEALRAEFVAEFAKARAEVERASEALAGERAGRRGGEISSARALGKDPCRHLFAQTLGAYQPRAATLRCMDHLFLGLRDKGYTCDYGIFLRYGCRHAGLAKATEASRVGLAERGKELAASTGRIDRLGQRLAQGQVRGRQRPESCSALHKTGSTEPPSRMPAHGIALWRSRRHTVVGTSELMLPSCFTSS